MEKVYEIHRTYTKSKSSHIKRKVCAAISPPYFLRLFNLPRHGHLSQYC